MRKTNFNILLIFIKFIAVLSIRYHKKNEYIQAYKSIEHISFNMYKRNVLNIVILNIQSKQLLTHFLSLSYLFTLIALVIDKLQHKTSYIFIYKNMYVCIDI